MPAFQTRTLIHTPLFIALLFLTSHQTRAQDSLQIDIAEMTQVPVTEMVQDQRGFLWISTIMGLFRYDGSEYKPYRHIAGDSSSIASNYINANALVEDDVGNLWMGTRQGLSRFDPVSETFKNFQVKPADMEKPVSQNISQVLLSQAGELWATTIHGVARFDTAAHRFEFFSHDTTDRYSVDSDTVVSLAEGPNGDIWVGSFYGLNQLDPASGKVKRHPLPGTPVVWSMTGDSQGHIWAGTENGIVFRVDAETGEMEDFSLLEMFSIPSQGGFVIDIYEDRAGIIWVGVWQAGLYRYDPAAHR